MILNKEKLLAKFKDLEDGKKFTYEECEESLSVVDRHMLIKETDHTHFSLTLLNNELLACSLNHLCDIKIGNIQDTATFIVSELVKNININTHANMDVSSFPCLWLSLIIAEVLEANKEVTSGILISDVKNPLCFTIALGNIQVLTIHYATR